MMKKLLGCLLLLVGICQTAYPIYFKHLGMQDGLSQLSVMAIYQDRLGCMWFGTEEGINHYDGVRMVAYKPSESHLQGANLIGNETHFIVGDRDGNVYFDSDGALLRYDLRQQRFERLRGSDVSCVASIDGTIWAGARDSLFTWDPEAGQLRFVQRLAHDGERLNSLWKDRNGTYWFGTARGLYQQKTVDDPLLSYLPGEDIYSLYEDSKHNLWISSRMNGVYKREPSGRLFHYQHDPSNPNSLSDNQARGFVEDNYGNLWIGTFTGLDKYNPANQQFEAYRHTPLPGSLSHSSVFPLYKDRQGTIWVGTYYGGVNYFNPEIDLFTVYTASTSRDDCLSFPFVGKMVEDREGNVWICTEGGGLDCFDRHTKRFTHYRADGSPNSIAHNNLKAIAYSPEREKLYIGTHTGGLSIFDLRSHRFKNPYFDSPAYAKLVSDRIVCLALHGDNLIFTDSKGLFRMDLETEQVRPLFQAQYGSGNFCIDSKGYIWLAHVGGLYRINLKDEKDRTHFPLGTNGLGTFPISHILEDREGHIFIGTLGSGLFRYDEKARRFIGYTAVNSHIASDYCYDLALSLTDQLVITGDKGITFFSADRMESRVIELGTALPLDGINEGCGILVCSNGETFVGGSNGLATFYEQDLFHSSKDYRLYFSGLYIHNEQVYPGDAHGVLTEALPYTSRLDLAHDQNNLVLSFTTNNYVNALRKATYEYRLEGFDEKWIPTPDNYISYTNLSPGTYTLLVREMQYDAPLLQPRLIRLAIHIHSPWYATWWAYLLYFLLTGGVLYSFYRFKRSQYMLQTSLALERKEKESIEELNQAKLQFFSNISHEFRTPLTLIISQVELLLQSSSLAPTVYNRLLKVCRNAYQMRGLITELLDFRKLEQGHIQLSVSEQELVPFLKEIYLSFSEYAASHSVTYHFTAPEGSLLCCFDPKQLRKVFMNLLSNAFKYNTKPYATIEMVVEDAGEEVAVKVIDNGIGIAQEDLSKIFDRFYQADNQVAGASGMPGSGIGLALTKGIVELHHGRIEVNSTPGYGSIFSVYLRKSSSAFSAEELARGKEQQAQVDQLPTVEALPDAVEELELSEGEAEQTRTVLLVEDNEELLHVLESLFAPTYRVVLARNGREGLEQARAEKPDLIVSDVMMPEMSGTEMCLKIKNDFELCHIPVVLLTALTSAEQSIEGLRRGADDYISKPFNARVLLVRCNNLLRNRIILQKKFSRQQDFDAQSLANNPIDQKLLDEVGQVIEKYLDDDTFSVDVLARELAVSRSSLYTKFKALTGMTPNEYILTFKLKRAAQWLTGHPEWQVSDIADRLAFGSPRYFTKCFKAQFGVSPLEYRKQGKG